MAMARNRITLLLMVLALSLIAGCASNAHEDDGNYRSSAIYQPPAADPNGSIYQAEGAYMPLFEDRRPQRVGDILTIVLDEQVSASKSSSSNANRSGTATFEPGVLPKGLERLGDYGAELSGDNTFTGGGASQATNQLTGTITVTVVQVLPNGNLVVSGEKQIRINQGTEFVRFSGVVNPRTVDRSNSVNSTVVADANISYTGKGYISESQRMGWLQRFFLNITPF